MFKIENLLLIITAKVPEEDYHLFGVFDNQKQGGSECYRTGRLILTTFDPTSQDEQHPYSTVQISDCMIGCRTLEMELEYIRRQCIAYAPMIVLYGGPESNNPSRSAWAHQAFQAATEWMRLEMLIRANRKLQDELSQYSAERRPDSKNPNIYMATQINLNRDSSDFKKRQDNAFRQASARLNFIRRSLDEER